MAKQSVDKLLTAYRSRRDFAKTAEPDHTAEAPGDALRFVIQKHDARRLHYDFRLEWGGVLKSWAVTKGPSLDPADKRLAVRTEDHPIAYGNFEGTIPAGQYGGGTVMLWDVGTWTPEGNVDKGLKAGKLRFRLHGKRLQGGWSLVRMGKQDGKRENWLLIKQSDETAERERSLVDDDTSIVTGRSMATIAAGKRPPPSRSRTTAKARGTRRPAMPAHVAPQLATLVSHAPEGDDWLSEMKYDGYRALIATGDGDAKVFTRNGKDWTDRFSDIAAAAAALNADGSLIDGEIVAFNSAGKTDFSTLQAAITEGGAMVCFVFDLLVDRGEDIRSLPLIERKRRLGALMKGKHNVLQLSEHIKGNAPEVYRRICEAGHEGIIAKLAWAPYRSGRGRDWLKIKCTRRQEFVIGGWSPSDKKGRVFASILIGVHEGKRLRYAGRVGSGFDEAMHAQLAARFTVLARKTSPFASALPAQIARDARFIRPALVAEVEFTEFTADGSVRHGVFKGLREDKPAAEVRMETPQESAMTEHETRKRIAGIALSHPDKVLYKGQQVTKADLAAHYERVATRMLPLVKGRLVSLVRCPDGRGKPCFFQKHEHKGFPEAIRRMAIEESGGGTDSYLYVDDLAGLIAGVQMGTLEFHIWGSRVDKLETPDRLVFDLDPDEGLDFSEVKTAAREVRDRLADIGLSSVPLLTGGKGIHVIAPLQRRADWAAVKAFARDFAKAMADDDPTRYVATASKAKRKGRIFIDYLRNERGSTAIAPYSTRAREGAPIATPVSWSELEGIEAANVFKIGDMPKRLAAADPWAESARWRQSLTRAMRAAVAND